MSTPTEPAAQGTYGIAKVMADYTVETYNLTDSPVRETVPNQHNQVEKEIRYDTRYDLRITIRGAAKPANTTITFDGQTYIVDTVEEAGSYNGLLRFNVTAHRYTNCNSETALS